MPCHVTCRVLVIWPGIEPGAHQWKPEIPTPRPPGNSPPVCSFKLEWQYFWELPWRGECIGLSVSRGMDHPVSSLNCHTCSFLSCVWHPKSRHHYTPCLGGQGNDCGHLAAKGWWGDLGGHSLLTKLTVTCPVFRPTQPFFWKALGCILSSWDLLGILRHALVCFQLNPPPMQPFLSLLGFPFLNCGCLSSAVLFSFLCFCGFICFLLLIFAVILEGFNWLIGKDPDAWKDLRQEEKGMIEGEMVGWHHQLSGREFERAPRVSDGQESLVCCGSWGCRELNTTEQLK